MRGLRDALWWHEEKEEECVGHAAQKPRMPVVAAPVGAVESCVGGTPVVDWTPPSGSLWVAHMRPLLPMAFRFALWDQGEADAKRSNSTW